MWQLPVGIKPENIVIYLRKSRADDPLLTVEEVLAKHEQMLDDWVARNLPGLGPVPEANRYREVVSGETLDSRPQVLEVLRRAESPRVRGVLIVEPQRLSRGDLEDIGRLVKLLRYSNTLAITLPYTYDLRDERDRDMFERELKRGNEFLEYQKRIMNNGRLLAVQNGNFIGQTAPYGYDKVQIKEGRKKCFTLAPNPETAPVVKLIFELYRDGMGMTRISDHLDALGIPAPGGGKWSSNTLPRFLRNEHYIGKVVWNRRAEVRRIEDGEVVVSRPLAEEYLVYEGKHPAIIDQELWDAVQEIRGKIPPNPKAHNFHNPLAGLLHCKNCGRVMTRRTYLDPKTGEERSAPRVACNGQRFCRTASSMLSTVLDEVVKALREAIDDFEIKLDGGVDDAHEQHRQLVARLEKRLTELQELEVVQWEEKTKGKMPTHVFERLNAQTLADLDAVQAELSAAKEAAPEPVDLRARQATFQTALDALLDPDAPAKKQNKLLKACIERIEYHRDQPSRRVPRGQVDPDTPISLTFQLRV